MTEDLPYAAAALMGRLPKTVVRLGVANGGLLLIDRPDQATILEHAHLEAVGHSGRAKIISGSRRPIRLQVLADDEPLRYQRPGMVMIASPSCGPISGLLTIVRLPWLIRKWRTNHETRRRACDHLMALVDQGELTSR